MASPSVPSTLFLFALFFAISASQSLISTQAMATGYSIKLSSVDQPAVPTYSNTLNPSVRGFTPAPYQAVGRKTKEFYMVWWNSTSQLLGTYDLDFLTLKTMSPVQSGVALQAIVFDETNGKLFGVASYSTSDIRIVSIDPSSGQLSDMMALHGSGALKSVTYDMYSSTIYVAASTQQNYVCQYYVVSLFDMNLNDPIPLPCTPPKVFSNTLRFTAFSPALQQIVGTSFGNLSVVDMATGEATAILNLRAYQQDSSYTGAVVVNQGGWDLLTLSFIGPVRSGFVQVRLAPGLKPTAKVTLSDWPPTVRAFIPEN